MSTPEIDISLRAGDWQDLAHYEALCRKAIETCCAVARLEMRQNSEVGIVLADDAFVRELNARHRGRDSATNVLAFPLCDTGNGPIGPLLGDVVLAFETLEREARSGDRSFDHHFCHLVVHGFFHLFGYDHQIEQDALVMESLETQVLGRLGIADPHAGAAA